MKRKKKQTSNICIRIGALRNTLIQIHANALKINTLQMSYTPNVIRLQYCF